MTRQWRAGARPIPVSESLAEVIDNPRLRERPGLDDGLRAQAGEVQPQ